MSNFQQQQSDRPFTIADTGKMTLWAPNGEGQFAMMNFNVNRKNQVTVTVRTKLAADTIEDGRIKAVMEPSDFYTWMEMVKRFAVAKEEDRAAFTFSDRKFIGPGKMTDGPVEQYTASAGRDENGIVYICLTAPKRPNIKFSFLSNTKNMFRDASGNEMDKRLESTLLALGRVNMMTDYIRLALDGAKTEVQYKNSNNQGGGNRQGGGGGWQGGNRGGQGGGQGGGGNNWGGGSRGQASGGGAASAGGDFGGSDKDIPW